MTILLSLLFFLTPLIYSSSNSELFELPKMNFVYGLGILIIATHLVAVTRKQVLFFKRSPLDLPLGLFLLSQIVSTLFSIDTHTSLFGYYSRLNGGLLSLLTYILIYWSVVPHITQKLKQKIIQVSLFSGLLVSGYGILEHFGIDKNVWVQDVQSRVFSTLGQPNWLAAYLCILLPLALYKFLNSKTFLSRSGYGFLVSCFYICLLFTKSKSGIAAALFSLGLYSFFMFIKNTSSRLILVTCFGLLVTSSLIVNNPIKDYMFPPKLTSDHLRSDMLITPSEDIRKIVWQGAFKLWQQFPLIGTGPETFAYSYYWVRPASHNLTSEWDFLYNKAHNEYINYLATTGSFGFVSYLGLILVTCYLLFASKQFHLFAAFISILITNFFGFSVVIISLYFFLLPLLILPDSEIKPKSSFNFLSFLVIFIAGFFLYKNLTFFLADVTYSQAQNLDSQNQYQVALNQINISLGYRPNESVYLIKAGAITSKLALINKNSDLAQKSVNLTTKALQISPFNLNLYKEGAQNYYYLSEVNKQYFINTLDLLTKASKLAPTDAKTFYTLGEFYNQIGETNEAIKNYQQALTLKSNYDHAAFALGQIYFDQKNYTDAKPLFEKVLQIAPTNQDAQKYLDFIATKSASHQ